MAKLKTCLHWAHRIFWYTVAGLIITLAIAISLVRIFIPDVKVYREQIEHVASAFLGQEVHIKSMDARLSGFTPLIVFRGVRMLDDTGRHEIVRFDEARLGLDWWRSLSNRKLIPKSFTVYGVKLGITRRKDHTLVLQGLNMAKLEQQLSATPETLDAESGELARWLFERSTLSLRHSTVVWYDALRGNKILRFDDVNFDIRNDGERHQFTGTITLPKNMGNTLAVAFDFKGNILNPAQWQGQFYTRGSALQIANWGIKPTILHTTLEQGLLDVEMWGQWQAGEVTALTTDVRTDNFLLDVGEQHKPLQIKQVSGQFDWRRHDNGWQLNIDNFRYQGEGELWPQSNVRVSVHEDKGVFAGIDAYSSYVQLKDMTHLLRQLKLADKEAQRALDQFSPDGELNNLHVHYAPEATAQNKFVMSSGFKGLSIKPYQHFPGINDLDGVLWMTQDHGEVKFADSSLDLDLPTLFRKPFAITRLEGNVQWWHAYDAWHVQSSDLAFESKDVQTRVNFNLGIPDNHASPVLGLYAHFVNGDVQQTWRYLPVTIMDDELVKWLDRSVVNGRVKSGDALFHGRVYDFPFRQAPGTFVVDFQAEDARLDYQKGWPAITANTVEARFTGLGMSITAPEAMLYHTQLHNTTVTIDKFLLPVLSIKGKFDGKSDDVVRFLVESPIASAASAFYKQSHITGNMDGQLSLLIPLSKAAETTTPADYRGYVDFKNTDVQAWQKHLVINDISGRLKFSPAGVFSQKLTGRFSGQPTQFTVYTRDANKRHIVDVSMMGKLDIAKLRNKLPLNGLENRIGGKTDWQGLLSFGSEDPAMGHRVNLRIASRLAGVRIDLPPPLQKAARDGEEFQLNMTFTDKDEIPLSFKLGDRLDAALMLRASPDHPVRIEKGTLAFAGAQAQLPEFNQLVLRGSLPDFPLDAWQAIRKQLVSSANLSHLNNLGLPIQLDLDHLHVTTQEGAPESPADDPRKMALINGEIRDLVYDDMQFGRLQIKTSHQPDGLHFDKIDLDAPNLKVTGDGSWFVRDGKQHTNVLLTVNSDNVGSMISRLGYKGVIRHGKARSVIQLNWPDAPNRFNFAKLNGSVGAVINDGMISNLEPGAGRLLGLLSLSELPRHLALDFSEFREGLKFKQILAQFDIVDGDAFTQNLHIVSPIALIDIDGRTGLAKRDYDLDVSVAPNVSKTLPVISWLAWGGQVGALTFVMDQLFGSKFNESIATAYRVTGTWEKPEIKEIPRLKPATEGQQP
ncbi:MAG: hypothetical protein GC149_04440 [Gammaproteobacteria bacterium]|nr:hypothetical protein [Gammaproteobacteria bacterium]